MKQATSRVLAITGTSGFIGQLILCALLEKDCFDSIIAIDVRTPAIHHPNLTFYEVDLTRHDAEKKLVAIFNHHQVTTLLHAALPSCPRHDMEHQHEWQTIGSLRLTYAAAAADVSHLVLTSTTDVYGARPDNPNYLSEDHPRRGGRTSPFIRDKIEVEDQFWQYSQLKPGRMTTILRMATLLGPTVENFKTHYLQMSIIPTVMGFDPLVQFLHENDMVRAVIRALTHPTNGVFNIAGSGVLPLSRVLRIVGRPTVPVPTPLVYSVAHSLWNLDLSDSAPSHVDFLKYICVADTRHAVDALQFVPRYSSLDAVTSFAEAHSYAPPANVGESDVG